MEEWNDGALEYWLERRVFSFLYMIPLFQPSIVPE
jgi:hypothetical protein